MTIESLTSPPQLLANEALVEVACCTLCGSDLHTFTGKRSTPVPTILGHEISGRIARMSDERPPSDVNGEALKIGDRVTWSVAASCRRCEMCRRGLPQKCGLLFKYGHERLSESRPLSGGLANVCHLVAGTAIVKLPSVLDDHVATPVSCATATMIAACRAAGDLQNRNVVIMGAGMLGLTAAAMASDAGAARVILCDVDQDRLNRVVDFGATPMLWEDGGKFTSQLRQALGTAKPDIILEVSGANTAVQWAIEEAAIGGTMVLVGSVTPTPDVAVNPESVVRRLLTIRGVHNYTPADLVAAVDFLGRTTGRFPFRSLVAESFTLDEVASAFNYALQQRPIRVAIHCS